MKLKAGDKAPGFSLKGNDEKAHSLEDYKGKRVLLYFYPKDNTPGCTIEAEMFRDLHKELVKQNVVVLGVSADSEKSHAGFVKKLDLPFVLLADPEHVAIDGYGVWAKKKFMGREYMGILRQSFLIDEKGTVIKIYDEVRPKIHAGQVLSDVCSIE